MELCVLILKEEDLLDEVLHNFNEKEINNVTVLSGISMVKEYINKNKNKDTRIFGTLCHLADYYSDESYILLIVCDKDKVNIISESIKINMEDYQYLFFTVSINNIQGKVN